VVWAACCVLVRVSWSRVFRKVRDERSKRRSGLLCHEGAAYAISFFLEGVFVLVFVLVLAADIGE
jgi:hypothetical protein